MPQPAWQFGDRFPRASYPNGPVLTKHGNKKCQSVLARGQSASMRSIKFNVINDPRVRMIRSQTIRRLCPPRSSASGRTLPRHQSTYGRRSSIPIVLRTTVISFWAVPTVCPNSTAPLAASAWRHSSPRSIFHNKTPAAGVSILSSFSSSPEQLPSPLPFSPNVSRYHVYRFISRCGRLVFCHSPLSTLF